jgi:hypothetical protein
MARRTLTELRNASEVSLQSTRARDRELYIGNKGISKRICRRLFQQARRLTHLYFLNFDTSHQPLIRD